MSRSGVASVFGMILAVAIIATTVIPLFLYVNQVNNMYDKTAEEMRALDQKRSLESLKVYIYLINNGSALNIQIKNVCVSNVRVVRIWVMVNNTCYSLTDVPELGSEIEPATTRTISGFSLPLGEKIVKVEVTTSRGNKFAAENNPLYASEDIWGWEPFTINVVMEADNGWVRRTIYAEYVGPNLGMNWNNTVEVTQLVVGGYASVPIGVPDVGYYKLSIWDNKHGYKHDLIFEKVITVSYAMPSPWVFVPK